ncbi:MAG: type IV secretion system DNA-binding domain-containing protein [Sphingomonadales bacterium]|nr:type IV secretion system DNA-binding domain-containing protein [Sphingomonadales bacterium]MDE2569596.1 type IV secretion system DNA-binding domain-containing protein [Sphingomonadales bacterium]
MQRKDDIRFDRRPVAVEHQSARGEVVRNVGAFTRGSQLIRLRYMMMMEGLRWPILATLVSFSLFVALLLFVLMHEHEVQLVEMRLFADFWSLVDLDTGHIVNLTLPDSTVLPIAIGDVPDYPDVAWAWTKFVRCILVAMAASAFLTSPLATWFVKLSQQIGTDILKERHERGAMLVAADVLIGEISAHNDAELGQELAEAHPDLEPLSVAKLPIAARAALGVHVPYTIAGVAYPWRLEQTHAMLIGTTGSGKTTQLRRLVAEARERGQRCVVFDLTGAFVEAFYRPATDHILNPMDERCPPWTIFNDCQNYADYISAAAALIPSDGGNAEPFWAMAARTLFVEMCIKLSASGETSNGAIAHHLMEADLKAVHRKLANTIASPLTAVEAARMAESIRAVFNTNAQAIRFLPDPVPGGPPPFSIRRWIQEKPVPGSILFITSTHTDLTLNRALLTLWMDLAVNALMGLPRTRDLRMWYLFDEVHALHRLPAIEHGLQTARGFGGAFVLGMHSFDKLAETYGEEGAINLASLARTKLILATADKNTAEVCSNFIGFREVRETDEAYSIGASRSRDAATITPRTEVKPLVIPDDIMNLPSLHGYVKFPEGFPAARIRLDWVDYPPVATPFQRKSDMQLAAYVARALDGEGGGEGQGDDGGSLPVTTAQEGQEAPTADAQTVDVGASKPVALPTQGMLDFGEVDRPGASEAPIGQRADEEAPASLPADDVWKASLRQHRSASRDADVRARTPGEQQAGLKPSGSQPAAVRREQQITVEERTGQAFADPSENGARHHPSSSHDDPAPPAGLDDGMDMEL